MQEPGNANMKELQKVSVVRDDHIHKLIWTSVIGKEFSLECKELNAHDTVQLLVFAHIA